MNSIPVLDWKQISFQLVAWVNGIECYTLKPVLFHGDGGIRPQWELRIENVATTEVQLIGVYAKPERAYAAADAHIGDSR
jgi:hypothetical protein